MSPNQENFEKLEAYIDGALEVADRAEVERQLAANPQLRKMVAELSMTRDLLRALPRAAAPAELMETFQGSLEREALLGHGGPETEARPAAPLRIYRWPQFMSIAAIVLLAVGLGLLVYRIMPQGHAPKMVATSQLTPTSSPPGVASAGDGTAAPSPVSREMKDGPTVTRSDGDGVAIGGRKMQMEDLKEHDVALGEGYASKGGPGGAGGGIMSPRSGTTAFGGFGGGGDGRKGGADDHALGAARSPNDVAAKQVDEKSDAGAVARGGVSGNLSVQRQMGNVNLKSAAGTEGAVDRLRARIPQQQNELADAVQQQQQSQQQERHELLLVNARDPQLARQDVSEFLAKNKIPNVPVVDPASLGANLNYGANLSLANNNDSIAANSGPTTTNASLNATAAAAAAPSAPAPSNFTSNSSPAGGNFNGANYVSNSAAGNTVNVNVDHAAAAPANGNGGYAQNNSLDRAAPAPAQQQQQMQQRAYSQRQSGLAAAGQGLSTEGNRNNDTYSFRAGAQPQNAAQATVLAQSPTTNYYANGGAYRALLTTHQQEELNRFLARRGDQWAEQHEAPPQLYARLQAIDNNVVQKQEPIQQQVVQRESVGSTDQLGTDEAKKFAAKPSAEAVERMKTEVTAEDQAATAQAPRQQDVQLRARRSLEAGAEGQVRMRSAQEQEVSKRSETNVQANAPTAGARGAAAARPDGAEDAEASGRSMAKALMPSASQPAAPALQAPAARGMIEVRDKVAAVAEANVADEPHEVIIVFNEQPARLPATTPTTAPAATVVPATQPAAVPVPAHPSEQSKP